MIQHQDKHVFQWCFLCLIWGTVFGYYLQRVSIVHSREYPFGYWFNTLSIGCGWRDRQKSSGTAVVWILIKYGNPGSHGIFYLKRLGFYCMSPILSPLFWLHITESISPLTRLVRCVKFIRIISKLREKRWFCLYDVDSPQLVLQVSVNKIYHNLRNTREKSQSDKPDLVNSILDHEKILFPKIQAVRS